METSIVIVSHERDDSLEMTLKSISRSDILSYKNDIEIIIVDLSYSKNTNKIVRKYNEKKIPCTYVHGNIEQFNISKLRNVGVRNSSGEKILFLDSGIYVNKLFFSKLKKKSEKLSNNDIVMYNTYCFNVEDDEQEFYHVRELLNDEKLEEIICENKWEDCRKSFFSCRKNNNGYLDAPAPWVIGWTCAILYSRTFFTCIGEFDENFYNWGSEDTDLAYRAYKENANFIFDVENFVVHYPHERKKGFNQNKNVSNLNNRMLMNSKYDSIDTELYVFFNGMFLNNVLCILENLELSCYTPSYSTKFIQKLKNEYKDQNSLIVGIDDIEMAKLLDFDNYFVHNHITEVNFNTSMNDKKIYKNIGICTSFEDNFFNNILVFDSYKNIPNELKKFIRTELERIGKKVIYIEMKNYNPFIYSDKF
jgi:Predicted glycosyltransferases